MYEKVYITGIGSISSIGRNIDENLYSLINKKSGINKLLILKTKHTDNLPCGEIKLTCDELAHIAGIKNTSRFTRTTLLGIIAAYEAFNMAKLADFPGLKTGIISGTSVGGMDKSENFYSEFYRDNQKGHIIDMSTHDCGDSTERIADYLGIGDYVSTISTACSSAANAIMLGARLICSEKLDRVVAGGTDALTRFTLNGFNSLMILDKESYRPFDASRRGLNLGEGAGYIVIESEESVRKSNKQILCELTGYGNTCDAYHQTATSPSGEGPYLAMKIALEMSKLHPSAIDYINAHGTGTENNDLTEGFAIKRLFGENIPPFSSTKTYTGHTLGAAGGIEAVFSILALLHQIIFPNLNFKEEIKELGIKPATEVIRDAGLKNVLSCSFGFGGNNTALIFSNNL
ncbi:MAG: beta-ketoacyl-[acyl-carrier-protein] synthase family protein [Bacteroidia bacterium]|nr:beta-ketoacyl-[acyl-carrier-protein] synthase family protein [Bacteroidia bacterium]